MARPAGASGKETAARARRAALALFARRGYAAVSMREIASEVGVGAGALYNHFATKQELLADLMAAHLEALIAAWDDSEEAAAPPREALAAFARFHMRYHWDKADAVFVSYNELRSLEPANFARVEALRSAYEGRLAGILAAGAASGAFHAPEPKIAAMSVIAMLTGVTQWYRAEGRLSAAEIEELYIDMVARAVRPDGGDA
ncbi:MAG: TetR/AcrR family transcriptional regulator [Pseudomonadota bacterium]